MVLGIPTLFAHQRAAAGVLADEIALEARVRVRGAEVQTVQQSVVRLRLQRFVITVVETIVSADDGAVVLRAELVIGPAGRQVAIGGIELIPLPPHKVAACKTARSNDGSRSYCPFVGSWRLQAVRVEDAINTGNAGAGAERTPTGAAVGQEPVHDHLHSGGGGNELAGGHVDIIVDARTAIVPRERRVTTGRISVIRCSLGESPDVFGVTRIEDDTLIAEDVVVRRQSGAECGIIGDGK